MTDDPTSGATRVSAGPPDTGYMLSAYAIVAVGALAGWALWELVKPRVYLPAPGVSIFAALYVFAQCIERVMEPLSSFLGTATDENRKTVKKAEAMDAFARRPSPRTRAVVTQVRHNRAVLIWAIASFLAMLASGSLGLLLLRSVGLTGAPVWADIFVTGLAIGSGTKPLHDLISKLQQSSSQKEASAAR